jgi:hypothetical protein
VGTLEWASPSIALVDEAEQCSPFFLTEGDCILLVAAHRRLLQ